MSLQSPKLGNSRRQTPHWIRLVLFAFALIALFILGYLIFGHLYRWSHVSVAVPPPQAPTASELRAIAAGLTVPPGFKVNAYATGLGEARVMVLTPKGDIILSSPASKVLLVKKNSGDKSRAGGVETLLSGLHNPSGLFLDGDQLYIAEEARILRVRLDPETRKLTGPTETVLPNLPEHGDHFTRTIKKGPGGYFYVSLGSSCNVCIEKNPWRAAMIRFKPGEPAQLFATGLRNTVGFDWKPGSNELYGVDNGRDWLGDEVPPEELNHLVEGGFYGWPYLYGDNQPDPEYGKRAGDRISHAIPPVYKLPAHVAPLSILFLRHTRDTNFADSALVTEHGSWNRSQKIGYKVVALHWRNGEITEEPFLSRFLKDGRVLGRPVDIIEDSDGTIFISDDYNGAIWRVASSS
jgi:glucose/arabinose dehydrogenase